MPNDHTAIAERLEACLVRASANMTVAAIDKGLLREAAQALTASADEVEQAREAHQDADEQWGLASRAHQKAEADLASARKALEVIAAFNRMRPAGAPGSYQRGYDIGFNNAGLVAAGIAREALRASTIGEEGEGNNSSSQEQSTTDDGGDNSSLRSDATAEDELRAALRDLVSWAKVTPPSHRPHGLIARAEEALR